MKIKISGKIDRAAWITFLALMAGFLSLSAAEKKFRLAAENKIPAQVMVNTLMVENPELYTAGIHSTAPGGSVQTIVASTLNVIDKPSDPPDLAVVTNNETIVSPNPKVPKLGIMLPLHDRTGKTIGALALAFRYPAGKDEAACFAKALAIRDRLAAKIGSISSLFADGP